MKITTIISVIILLSVLMTGCLVKPVQEEDSSYKTVKTVTHETITAAPVTTTTPANTQSIHETITLTIEPEIESKKTVYINNEQIVSVSFKAEEDFNVWFYIEIPDGTRFGIVEHTEGNDAGLSYRSALYMNEGYAEFSPAYYDWESGDYIFSVHSDRDNPIEVTIDYWIR